MCVCVCGEGTPPPPEPSYMQWTHVVYKEYLRLFTRVEFHSLRWLCKLNVNCEYEYTSIYTFVCRCSILTAVLESNILMASL